MDKRIIINADDFGLCDGVNNAVSQAHTDGVLRSATIMANMPAADQAVEIAKQLPTLGVGVHLNLTDGRPVSVDPSVRVLLDAAGQFTHPPSRLSLLSIAGHKIRNAIKTELAAQIQWVIDNGLAPTHLDSHKHIHIFPAIFSIVCELARRFDISAIRCPFEPKALSKKPWPLPSAGGKKRAQKVRIMARINRIQNPYFLKTDALLGIAHAGKIDVNFFRAVALYNSSAIVEIMTHPGLPSRAEASPSKERAEPGKTTLQHQRKGVELNALCSEITKQYLKDAGIKLVHYGQL